MNYRSVAPVLVAMVLLLAVAIPATAQDSGTVFKIGASPPAQGVYTKVNLTEPYNIIQGWTIYPSLHSPDLFYYYPKPRVVRTKEGRLVFRLLSYAMAENKNQVGSADVAGGYLQFDVTMSPTLEEEKAIKQELLNGPKRFGGSKSIPTLSAASLHPYTQIFGKTAKPKNVKLAPIPIDDLKAKAHIPGVLATDKVDTEWFKANGDASGSTTFAINLSGPQSIALYQAIMEPAAVEPFNVYFDGILGGYVKCNASMQVNTSEVFKYLQNQSGSSTKTEIPGKQAKQGCSIFGIQLTKGSKGRAAESSQVDVQNNSIDASNMIGTAIKISGDMQGYDDALMAMAKYALDGAVARFGQPITMDELMDEKKPLEAPPMPTSTPGASSSGGGIWAVFTGLFGSSTSKADPGRRGYYGYFDNKSFQKANSMSFSVDLNKQIAVERQFSPSTSIFDDAIVNEIRQNGKMYAQKLALNDPFFEKLDITYGAHLDFSGGPFNKVVFTDLFKLKDGTNYSVPGLLLESKDVLDATGKLLGAAPPSNLRFGGLLQGNLSPAGMGSSFNILDPAQRRSAYSAKKWPTYDDGTQVSGITHRWKYSVYFRPSTKDPDFPSKWDSPAITNSQTVCLADIPPKVTVITLSSDALDQNRVKSALVKIRYHSKLDWKSQPDAVIVKSVKLRPGGPDKDVFFYDDDPKINKSCEYAYQLLYNGAPSYKSDWIADEGGWIVLEDPGDKGGTPLVSAPVAAPDANVTNTVPVFDDATF